MNLQIEKPTPNANANEFPSPIEDTIIIVCLQCRDTIPLFKLFKSGTHIWIETNCTKCKSIKEMPLHNYLMQIKEKDKKHTCTVTDFQQESNPNPQSHSELPANQYCVDCKRWLCEKCLKDHIKFPSLKRDMLLSRELIADTFCTQHNNLLYKYYCKDCYILLCEKCIETSSNSHMNHSIIRIENLVQKLLKVNYDDIVISFDNIQSESKRIKDRLVYDLNLEIEYLNKIKQDLEDAYLQNEENNKTIKELFLMTQTNFILLQEKPLYNLFQNIDINFSLNDSLINLNEQNQRLNALKCIEYFNTNFIVQINTEGKSMMTLNDNHEGAVNCLIEMTDGRLVSCSDDKTIKIWKLNNWVYECELTLKGHQSGVYTVNQLNDSKLMSGSYKEIKIWDLSNGECISTLLEHSNSIFVLTPLNKKEGLFISAGDNQIKVWDTATFNCINTLSGHTDVVYCLIELRDGRIASGSNDKLIKLWTVEAMKCDSNLIGHSDKVNVLLQLNDGRLASGSCDLTIRLWTINESKQVGVIEGFEQIVLSLIQLNSDVLISGDENICLWNIDVNSGSSKLIKTLSNMSYMHKIILLKDGRLASCSENKGIALWNISY